MSDDHWTLARTGFEVTQRPSGPAISLRVRLPDEAVQTRAAALLGAALPLRPGHATTVNGARLCWLAPGEWLLLDFDLPAERLAATLAPATCHVAESGEAFVRFRITGERALAVLAKGTSLDLPALVAAGSCARTRFAQIHALFVVPTAGESRLDLVADISCTEHLKQWFSVATLDLVAEGNFSDRS